MRLRTRLAKLESHRPKCDGRITRVEIAPYEPTEADRCALCGGCHVLVIRRLVVNRAEVENASLGTWVKS